MCCCIDFPYYVVSQGKIGLVERFGRFKETLKPGMHQFNPLTETVLDIDTKTQVIDLERQLILTKDNITVSIDTVVFFRVINPIKAVYQVNNIQAAVSEITYATLRTVCGEHTLQDLLEQRQKMSDEIELFVEKQVETWGVFIEQAFIKDMLVSPELQSELSMTAKAKRLGESKVISAKADVESAKLMKEAADALDSKPAMQIRYLEIIQAIGKAPGEKLLFLPLDQDEKS